MGSEMCIRDSCRRRLWGGQLDWRLDWRWWLARWLAAFMVFDISCSQIDPRCISRRLQLALLGSFGRPRRRGPLRGRDRAVLKILLKFLRHQKNIAVVQIHGQALVNSPARNALQKTIPRQSGSGRGGSAEGGLGVRFRVAAPRVDASSAFIIHLCPQLKITLSRIDSSCPT